MDCCASSSFALASLASSAAFCVASSCASKPWMRCSAVLLSCASCSFVSAACSVALAAARSAPCSCASRSFTRCADESAAAWSSWRCCSSWESSSPFFCPLSFSRSALSSAAVRCRSSSCPKATTCCCAAVATAVDASSASEALWPTWLASAVKFWITCSCCSSFRWSSSTRSLAAAAVASASFLCKESSSESFVDLVSQSCKASAFSAWAFFADSRLCDNSATRSAAASLLMAASWSFCSSFLVISATWLSAFSFTTALSCFTSASCAESSAMRLASSAAFFASVASSPCVRFLASSFAASRSCFALFTSCSLAVARTRWTSASPAQCWAEASASAVAAWACWSRAAAAEASAAASARAVSIALCSSSSSAFATAKAEAFPSAYFCKSS
mmetsp:Transcript_110546/g.323437  ORF Transcript_110546/g.323437 Transcript_110546/m.323437 type:complete len:390 (-) Transcript_110546:2060-3229(-)